MSTYNPNKKLFVKRIQSVIKSIRSIRGIRRPVIIRRGQEYQTLFGITESRDPEQIYKIEVTRCEEGNGK
jgi:hypothetical protein